MGGPLYPKTDDPDTTFACPECDSCNAKLHTNWYCLDCGATFDEPIEREKYNKNAGPKEGEYGGGRSSLGLEDLDPEDVGLSPVGSR